MATASAKRVILMIGWEYPPHIAGGLGVACRGIARALGSRGHRVIMMLPRVRGDEPCDEGVEFLDASSGARLLTEDERAKLREIQTPPGKDAESEYEFESTLTAYPAAGNTLSGSGAEAANARRPGSSFDSAGNPGEADETVLSGGYGNDVYREVQTYAEIARLLSAKLDFDIVYAHDWMTFPAGRAAALESSRPLICHAHATEFDRSGENVNPLVHRLEREAFRVCDRVVAVSAFTGELLERRYHVDPAKIQVVHNGVDIQEYSAGSREEGEEKTIKDRIVLFLGRITFQKGPDYFTKAARKVIESLPNTRFVMAGPDGGMYDRMVELAAELGIGDHFHYTGPLNRRDVRRMYRMSDLYIMPSVSEPFGIAPLEAVANGVPVIVSKQSGVSEVLSGCFKVDFWNTDELAEKIITILRDEKLAAALARAGYTEAVNITWDRTAAGLERAFDSILEQ